MKIGIVKEKRILPRGGKKAWQAMKNALARDGHEIVYSNTIENSFDMVLLWNVQFRNQVRKSIWDFYRSRKIPILVMEAGALKRNHLWRVGINGIDNQAYYNNKNSSPERWNNLGIELKPWKLNKNGGILICLQNQYAQHWPYNYNVNTWTNKCIDKIREQTNRRIYVRPHPTSSSTIRTQGQKNVRLQKPNIKSAENNDFQEKMNEAWCVVNPSSNPAIEAAIAGIPVFTSPTSLASPVSNHDLSNIENPVTPDRKQWAYDLAHTEWSIDEIDKGIAWNQIKNYFN